MVKQVPISEIADNPYQPRTTFDPATLRSLAEEIRAEGFWQSGLQGRRSKNGKVELVFGHRRLRALRLLHVPSVKIDIVDLTDAQMALRSLEENLQREGLTDLEKADAVKSAVELVRSELQAAGKSESHAVQQVADRLGLSVQWVASLCKISSSMHEEIRKPIKAGYLTGQTALAAKEWGGDTYVRTLAKQGKAAATTGDVPKPTHMTVSAMRRAVAAAPEPIRDKLKEEIISGEIDTPAEVESRARRLAAGHTRRAKLPPPDLREVIVGWTHRIKEWEKDMRDVAPYMAYVDEVPQIAKPFRAALGQLIETAKRLL